MKSSIHTINRGIVSFFFLINTLFLLLIIWYAKARPIDLLASGDIILNMLLVLAYFFVNRRYVSDLNSLVEHFRKALGDTNETFASSEHFFIENKRIETLFKKAYIKNNLLKKDFTDLKTVFEKFIPQDIYKEIGFRGYEKIILGSSKTKHLTIMFLDIMGFTRISEQISPERVLFLLNIYFDGIGEIIYKNGGYIDKFLGDGIMIIFEQETSDSALICAIEVQDFIKRFQVSAIGKKINIGIGINTGEVIVGTIGTKRRMDATVIGDTVNVASRLEGLTRKYEKNIIISQDVLDRTADREKFSTHLIGKESLKGKDNEITIYAVDDFFNIKI